ncbi:MAG: VWA domain-containing protein, partial [Vicinamibacterales bacterium]
SVTVADERGAFVAGLRPEQFTVYDEGHPQAVEFFTSGAMPATIGLVIDSSSSMRTRRPQLNAAADVLTGMRHPLDEWFTLHFNEAVWPGLPPGVDFTSDEAQFRAALAAPSRGMTALYDALMRGLAQIQRGTHDRKALIVASDGGDNASAHALADVVTAARRAGVVIYAVRWADPDNREARPETLKALAAETGGRTFVIRAADDLPRAFADIAQEIRQAYVLGFTPSQMADGRFHSIQVMVDLEDGRRLRARTRAGYDAGQPAK